MLGRLYPVEGQWYEWRQEPPLPATVLVRIAPGCDGRLLLAGLRVEGTPTAELLRAIPVGRIEAVANAQLTTVDDAVVPAVVARRSHPHAAAADPRGWEITDPRRALDRPRHDRPPSEPAGRRGRPDTFYERVAHEYLRLAQTSPRPATDLAEAHGVPVTTAHRWIKEARRRRFLPPGRPGKSG